MKRIVYIVFGRDEFYIQAAFSILSLKRYSSGKDIQIHVIAQDKGKLADYISTHDLDIRQLPSRLMDYTQSSDYVYALKPLALEWFVSNFVDKDDLIIFLDVDTCLIEDIDSIFSVIRSNVWVLNLCEGIAQRSIAGRYEHSIKNFFKRKSFLVNGNNYQLSPHTPLWNSGVIGFCADQNSIIQFWIEVMNAMRKDLRVLTVEQVALSYALNFHKIGVVDCLNVVDHYYDFQAYKNDLMAFFEYFSGHSDAEKIHWVDQFSTVKRRVPKINFDNNPKFIRSLRKRLGLTWRPLPYPWL